MISPRVSARQRAALDSALDPALPKTQRACANGCGRILSSRCKRSVCSSCQRGLPPLRPDPAAMPVEYLLACALELKRRQQQIADALREAA